MARSDNNLSAVFTDTANAIRAKTGGSTPIIPRDFADEIATIETGSGEVGDLSKLIDGSIEEIDAPEVSYIRQECFKNLTQLSQASFTKCIKIDSLAFTGCNALEKINCENCLDIESSAFLSCNKLSSFHIKNCINIGSSAFMSCVNLSSFEISGFCVSMQRTIFAFCTSLEHFSVVALGGTLQNYTFSGCVSLKSIELPNISSIASPFAGCTSLKHVYIPQFSVIQIGGSAAFSNTPILDSSYLGEFGSIYVPSNKVSNYKTATNWATISNRITALPSDFFSKNIVYAYEFANESIEAIPSGKTSATHILRNAFMYCSSLFQATFNNCIDIASQAFFSCKTLTTVSFPNCEHIGNSAFYYCSQLTTVSFPKCLYIEQGAFIFCNGIKSMYLLNSCVTSLAVTASSIFTINSDYTIYVKASLLSQYVSNENWSVVSEHLTGLTDEEIAALE